MAFRIIFAARIISEKESDYIERYGNTTTAKSPKDIMCII